MANNALFILALVAMPLFIWRTRGRRALRAGASPEEQAAAAAVRSDTLFRWGAVAGSLVVMTAFAALHRPIWTGRMLFGKPRVSFFNPMFHGSPIQRTIQPINPKGAPC